MPPVRSLPDGMVDPVGLLLDDLPTAGFSSGPLGCDDLAQTWRQSNARIADTSSMGGHDPTPMPPLGRPESRGGRRTQLRPHSAQNIMSCSISEARGGFFDSACETDDTTAILLEPRAGGRNWRGVHRPTDSGNLVGASSKQDSVVSCAERQASEAAPHGRRRPGRWGAIELDPQSPAAELSTGPARSTELGCELGMSTQYSCRSDAWWEKSSGTSSCRKGQSESLLLGSQRPQTPPGGVAESGPTSNTWPSGRPMQAGGLPPLKGESGGSSSSAGLSLSAPEALPTLPMWLRHGDVGQNSPRLKTEETARGHQSSSRECSVMRCPARSGEEAREGLE